MSIFISDAFAAAAEGQARTQGDGAYSMLMIAGIFALFYFMLIRPQNKRAKDHRRVLSQLQKGDEVVTTGGIMGKIAELDENIMKLVIADGVEIKVQRQAVTNVLPKGTLKSKS